MTLPVTLDDVEAARERIARHVHRTPVMTSRRLDARAGCRLFFKCETFQRVGAFKARGAFSRLTLLTRGREEARRRRVLVRQPRSGRRARGAGARRFGGHRHAARRARRSSSPRRAATAPRCALYDRAAREPRKDRRSSSSGDGPNPRAAVRRRAVIAGQGTAALELLEDVPDLDAVLTPLGGGGLLSGVAVAVAALRPGARVFGVEPEAGDDFVRSLAAGHPVAIPVPADDRGLPSDDEARRPHVRARIALSSSGVVTVSDLELRRAMSLLFSVMKLVVEPGATAGFAGVLSGRVPRASPESASASFSRAATSTRRRSASRRPACGPTAPRSRR